MTDMQDRIEQAARRWCELDTMSPEPDAPIMVGMKPAKAWKPRAKLIEAILPDLFPDARYPNRHPLRR